MNIPNKLTITRVVLVPVFLSFLMLSFDYHILIAGIIFCIAAFTDLLDGKIARCHGIVTNFGKFLDPIADKVLTTAAFIWLLSVGKMNVWVIMLILTREFAVTSVRLIAAGNGKVIDANIWGKLKTVFQYIAIIYMLAELEFENWQYTVLKGINISQNVFQMTSATGQVLLWAAAALTAIAGIVYIYENRLFLREQK